MEEKNQQEKMAIVRQVELFENAFNKAKEMVECGLTTMVAKHRNYI